MSRDSEPAPPPFSDGLTLISSFMLATAGLAHLSVAPAHFGEWWLFGLLFLIAAGLQLWLALWLVVRPSRALFGAAVALSAGLVATWILSRTSGLPFGPGTGEAEAVGALDVLTTLNEVVLIALLGIAVAARDAAPRALLVACEASGIVLGVVLALAFAGGVGHG